MRPSKYRLFFTKLTQWEFWPFELVYFPVVVYYLWLSLKARSFFFFSASNPSIETGGMMGESKNEILKNIPDDVKAFTLFFKKNTAFQLILDSIKENKLSYPIIAKPDVGERGTSVEKINSEEALISYLKKYNGDLLIQEYVDFEIELGIFYYRYPNESSGTISSVVMKDFLSVVGDGNSTLRKLISEYPRAAFQFDRLHDNLNFNSIPLKDQKIILEPIGNHCRGTTFLDANTIIDQKLITVFDKISKQVPGFYFGRYDLRCKSITELKEGKYIKIVELNGAGAEPGHIYQPGFSIFEGWKVLLFHWNVLYKISKQNHKNGIQYMSFKEARLRYKVMKSTKKSTL